MSFVTVSFRRRGVFSAIALSLVLTGCGSVSEFTENINPFAREKILKGERQPCSTAPIRQPKRSARQQRSVLRLAGSPGQQPVVA